MITGRITVTTKGGPLDKNTLFALASALTLTAKQAQADTIKEIGGAFQIRTRWSEVGPFSVRIKPATKNNLEAWVGTAAEWLEKFVQEPAGSTVIKLPQGEYLAIPTTAVRRSKRDLIRASQRPRALEGKRDFVIPISGGRKLLLQRQGRGKQKKNVVLYLLVPRARVKAKDVLFGPARRAFEKHFSRIYEAQLVKAFAPRGGKL